MFIQLSNYEKRDYLRLLNVIGCYRTKMCCFLQFVNILWTFEVRYNSRICILLLGLWLYFLVHRWHLLVSFCLLEFDAFRRVAVVFIVFCRTHKKRAPNLFLQIGRSRFYQYRWSASSDIQFHFWCLLSAIYFIGLSTPITIMRSLLVAP